MQNTTPFLYEVAEALVKQGKTPDSFTIIFPNRRSILYFRKHFSGFFNRPVFGPELLTFDEWITGLTHAEVPDKIRLVYELYKVYRDITGWNESLDSFYYWGSMLLRDFDEIDKHLVNPDHVFRDLSNEKELDAAFDYLTEEQKKFLNDFWSGFNASHSNHRARFKQLWIQLAPVYHAFQEVLTKENLTYEGRLYREASTRIHTLQPPARQMVFAGFNALTPAQEKIVVHAVKEWNVQVYWDVDEYYLNSEWQEAGLFLRKYKSHAVLGRTFPADVPANFRRQKNLKVYGSPQATGQAKILAQVLQEALQSGMKPEEAVIVLPDEKMLLPVLHAVSEQVEKLNVSISYPLRFTPLPSFIEQIGRLQNQFSKDAFSGAQVLSLLSHPWLRAVSPDTQRNFFREITRHNRVRVPVSSFSDSPAIIRLIFRPVRAEELPDYLVQIFQMLSGSEEIGKPDREYINQALRLLLQLQGIPEAFSSWDTFLLLYRQLINETRIPFVGEPLQGLPVIGMLETRNLDFKYVFMLSVNEGALPPFERSGSYLTYSLRKAYGLPVANHDDAISAYLFYRILQRAQNIALFYNTEPDDLGRGEMSRFLQQLLLESDPRPQPVIVTNRLKPQPVRPIVIEKTDEVWEQLMQRQQSNWKGQGLTPTALYSYLVCGVQFYFRYVLGLREAREIEEDMNARVTGNILHDTLEIFYKNLTLKKKTNLIEPSDLEKADDLLATALDQSFQKAFGVPEGHVMDYEGRLLIMREVIARFAHQVIRMDRAYAPFELLGTEQADYRYRFTIPGTDLQAETGGKIDRIDRKDDVVRIIDYKTGADKMSFKSLEELFTRGRNPEKAVFQIFLYALLYLRNNDQQKSFRIVPGIMGRKQIFADDFRFGLTDDARPMLDEFEARLKDMISELFSREVAFTQTSNVNTCEYCAFKRICYR
ncbi:MAG: PD-(D/E)XK nuclease family protein [Cyclobacteriaceae bacterium]|nr:PD-(D/E)XK nuclease family protein [Cyclobacteriaceae bacterium]